MLIYLDTHLYNNQTHVYRDTKTNIRVYILLKSRGLLFKVKTILKEQQLVLEKKFTPKEKNCYVTFNQETKAVYYQQQSM